MVEANFRTHSPKQAVTIHPSRTRAETAAARINEALLAGREPLPADLDAVRYAIEQARSTKPLELLKTAYPVRYWQEWLISELAAG